MEKFPPPLLGFNNNVRHQGRVFHIQTEDSGARHARIVTHLFADGGRILRTTRTDYSDRVGRKDMAEHLRQLMKQQHKAMFLALRAGELDDAIALALGGDPEVDAEVPSSARITAVSVSPEPKDEIADTTEVSSAVAPRRGVPRPEMPPPPPDGERPIAIEPPERRRGSGTRERAAVGHSPVDGARPASLFETEPMVQRSIFSDGLITEPSLDEVILSYLSDDVAGSSSKE